MKNVIPTVSFQHNLKEAMSGLAFRKNMTVQSSTTQKNNLSCNQIHTKLLLFFRVEKFHTVVYQIVYIPSVTGINWATAEERCSEDIGGHLASIHTETAFDYLK